MKCTYCGTELNENQTVCPNCGAPVQTQVKDNNKRYTNPVDNFLKSIFCIIVLICLVFLVNNLFKDDSSNPTEETPTAQEEVVNEAESPTTSETPSEVPTQPAETYSPSLPATSNQTAKPVGHTNHYSQPNNEVFETNNNITPTVDLKPYVRELQRRVNLNWTPTQTNSPSRTKALLKISRDGRLLASKISLSSGNPSMDKSVLEAIQLTAPFRPLPPGYNGESLIIELTFNNN